MKKTLFAAFFLSILSTPSMADDSVLAIELTGMKRVQGSILGVFYRSETDFLSGENPVQPVAIPVTSTTMRIEFRDLPDDPLMFSVFHDANNNGELDKNLFGIPQEIYGASNNARGSFGPPKFADAVFTPSDTENMTIQLK